MKLGEIVKRVVIDPRKLTDYAPDPDNPKGRHKAIVFAQRLGFTKDNHATLLRQIETLALGGKGFLQRTDQYGSHYRVDLEVTGREGQLVMIRTGWLVPPGSDTAYFVTCYVLRKG